MVTMVMTCASACASATAERRARGARWSPRAGKTGAAVSGGVVRRRVRAGRATRDDAPRAGDIDDEDATTAKRRAVLAAATAAATAVFGLAPSGPLATRAAKAEYGESVYMDALQGSGKDYGKSSYIYPDFTVTKSGLQYKDMKEGTGTKTYDANSNATAVIDWDGYTIGYYGRPFEARNKSKGGAFTGDEKEFFRFKASDESVIPAFREAIAGMRVGSIRRIIVSPNSGLGYPDGRAWRKLKPQPANFSGERALGFVLESQGMIDKTLLFDIELINIVD